MQPDAELGRAGALRGAGAQVGDLGGDRGGRLAPGEVGVDLLRGEVVRFATTCKCLPSKSSGSPVWLRASASRQIVRDSVDCP